MYFSVMVVLLSVTSLSSVSFLFLHCLSACLPARISYVQECVFDDFRGKVCGVVIVAGLWSDVLWLRSILYSALVVCFCFCVFAVLFYTQNGR